MVNYFVRIKVLVVLLFFVFNDKQGIAQNPVPSLTLSPGTTCIKTPISASGSVTGGTATSYAWTATPAAAVVFSSPNSQNTNIVISTPGTYAIVLTVQPGGGSATTNITITAPPDVTVTSSADTICKGGAGATLTAAGASTYVWQPATGLSATTGTSVTATPTATTIYSVIGTSNGCNDTAKIKVNVKTNVPVIATTSADTICVGVKANLNATAPGATAYTWAPSTGLSCTNCQSPVFTPTAVGTYTMEVTAKGLCISPDKDTVKVVAKNCKPIAGFIFPDPIWICRFDCVKFIDTSKYAPLKYKWILEGGTPDTSYEQSPTVCYNIESTLNPFGGYTVKLIVENSMGLKDSVSKFIIVKPTPIASVNNGAQVVTIQTGDEVTLDASSWTLGASSFYWTPNTDLSCDHCGAPVASPLFTTTYIVTAAADNGCVDKDTIIVKVDLRCGEVFVPNVFTPNKDGSNDVLRVKNNCLQSIEFIIYDRWGEQVYVSKNPYEGWDGTYNGKPLDAGVFVYKLTAQLVNGNTVEKKGNITLIR